MRHVNILWHGDVWHGDDWTFISVILRYPGYRTRRGVETTKNKSRSRIVRRKSCEAYSCGVERNDTLYFERLHPRLHLLPSSVIILASMPPHTFDDLGSLPSQVHLQPLYCSLTSLEPRKATTHRLPVNMTPLLFVRSVSNCLAAMSP